MIKLDIYQIYYRDTQKRSLDPSFIPYDNRLNSNPDWCEYHIFETEYKKRALTSSTYLGFLSWKFKQKTSLTGKEFKKFIEDHPGYDVYYVNPFPTESYFYKNVWKHGQTCHPGLLEISQKLLDKAGYKIDLNTLRHEKEHFAFCNYWVGNSEFWQTYLNFCTPIVNYIKNDLTEDERKIIFSNADKVSTCCYIPYIMERMFSTLLTTKSGIKALAYPTPYPEFLKDPDNQIYMDQLATLQKMTDANPPSEELQKIEPFYGLVTKAALEVNDFNKTYLYRIPLGLYKKFPRLFKFVNETLRPIVTFYRFLKK